MFLKTDIRFKSIHKLAVPALIAGIAEPLLSITDTAIVGNIDNNATESLAAVGIVGAFISMLVWVFGQIRSVISSIVSQYLGAQKLDDIKPLPAQIMLVVVLSSLVILAISYPFAEQIFKFYNASGIILDYCVDYFRIRIFGLPFSLFVFAVFGTFRGLQNTFYPMVIALFGAVLNIGLDWIFVYGISGVIPAMHIQGAAYASVIAQISMALLASFLLLKKTPISLKITLPFHKEMKRSIGMVFHLFIRTVSLNIALYFGTSYATSYGSNYIAAYTIGLNLWFLGAFIIDGYSSVGNILSGKLLGGKEYGTLLKLSNVLSKYGMLTGIVMMTLGFLFYKEIGMLFTKEEAVLKEFYAVFWLVLIMQPLCALTFVFDAFFKGMGEMKYLRNVLLVSTFFVFIPSLFILDAFDYKLHAIWMTFLLWIFARGLPLIIKFRRKFLPLRQKN